MARTVLQDTVFCLIIFCSVTWGFRHTFDVPERRLTFKQNTNVNYSKIIKFLEEHKNEFVFNDDHKELVLVMGNTGAGKTTLVSALVGRKLRSVEKEVYYVFEDEDGKIGTDGSTKTLIPEVMTDVKRNISYVDCLGFPDNREVEYEISSMYFQNMLMSQVKKVKLLLVINHESLKITGNKNDIDDLFEQIGEFIKDFSKIHVGVALIATKVANSFERDDDGKFVVANNSRIVLEGISDYLEKKKESYLYRTEDTQKHKMFADLIGVLLQKKGDLNTRIALFSQPLSPGPLEALPKTVNEMRIISDMVVDHLHYVETKKDDFGFVLTEALVNTIDEIVKDIQRRN